jgi:peptide/nickel transport system substrate-binding protein
VRRSKVMPQVGRRPLSGGLALLALALGIAGCGGGGSKSTTPKSGSAVTLLMSVGPDSLDPAVGNTSQALEADWLVYTPLLTYAHGTGVAGTQLIPGLAVSLPMITDGGKTYTLMLRKGLVYSSGRPVKAGDFTWAVERAVELSWAGSRQFITSRIDGASAFAQGKAKTISGITANDATGQITIRLAAPYGPFENVLALPSMAPVPPATPLTNEQSSPPPGVGPYKISKLVVGRSFSLVKNARWARMKIPGIPAGHLEIDVRVSADLEANASSVLHNTADVFDWADRIPSDLQARIEHLASDRYSTRVMNGTYLIFLNVTRKPFSSQLAREAVLTGLDENTIKRLSSGTLLPGCHFLPPGMYGHLGARCPDRDAGPGGNLAAAKALVERSRMSGTRVTVWSGAGSPFREWMAYYTSLLDSIGFKATQKLIPDARYYAKIGDLKLHPQTGFADFHGAFPNPVNFYQPLTGAAIVPKGNQNWGEVNDPYLNAQVSTLAGVPAGQLSAVVPFWHVLEGYLASKAYVAVFGYQTFPEFVSDRIDYAAIVVDPVVGFDWSSFQLK